MEAPYPGKKLRAFAIMSVRHFKGDKVGWYPRSLKIWRRSIGESNLSLSIRHREKSDLNIDLEYGMKLRIRLDDLMFLPYSVKFSFGIRLCIDWEIWVPTRRFNSNSKRRDSYCTSITSCSWYLNANIRIMMWHNDHLVKTISFRPSNRSSSLEIDFILHSTIFCCNNFPSSWFSLSSKEVEVL